MLNAFWKIGVEVLDCVCDAWEEWVVCYFEHGVELWSSIIRKFLDYLSEHCGPQKDWNVSGIIVTVII